MCECKHRTEGSYMVLCAMLMFEFTGDRSKGAKCTEIWKRVSSYLNMY